MTKGKGAPEKINIKFCAHSSRRAVFKAKFLFFPASYPPWHTVRSKRSKREAQQNTYALAPPGPRLCVFCFFSSAPCRSCGNEGQAKGMEGKAKTASPYPPITQCNEAGKGSTSAGMGGKTHKKGQRRQPVVSGCRVGSRRALAHPPLTS